MSTSVEQLLEKVLQLPDNEQVELLRALQSSVDERGLLPFDNAWLEEIQRRSAEFDAGLVQPIPWEEARENARRKLRSHE